MKTSKEVKPWGFLGDIGAAIQEYAEGNGYSVVRDFGGHGVGLDILSAQWEHTILVTEEEIEVISK